MKRVAVLGGGPAGAFAAHRLASAGLDTVVFDEKLAWEKPCGGGLTYKAYKQYPFLIENDTPKRVVTETWLTAPKVGSVRLKLEQPLLIYSRLDLNRMLLERAEKAGAQIEKTRVQEIERHGSKWRLKTGGGSVEADFCVVATGARNPFREVGTQLTPNDTMTAMGYYVPSDQPHIDIQFLPGLQGYIWVFPRCGHLSVGIGAKSESAQSLRQRLEKYMDERGIAWKGARFYSHLLPSLDWPAWKTNRVAGDGWLAVGDAAGLVDPITGEGIYYAMRSGDLAAQILLNEGLAPAQKSEAYRATLESDFARDLEFGASFAQRVFMEKFLFEAVPARMVQFIRRSPRFRALMQELFAGTQGYLTLKGRLMRSLNGTIHDVLMSFLVHRLTTGTNQV
jgi:geranylgeranyl reductase family protein